MTEVHPAASLNRVRLLTMSKHPNQIRTDRFVPLKLHSTYLTRRIDKKLMEIDQNDQNPSNSIIQLRMVRQILGKTQWKKQRRRNNPGSWPSCKRSVIHWPGQLQTLMAKLFLQDSCTREWTPHNSPLPNHIFLGQVERNEYNPVAS